jgi:hypothetical protein
MIRKSAVALLAVFVAANSYSQNVSVSFDPLTFIGMLLLPSSDQNREELATGDIRNLWICVEANWELKNRTEMGAGLFIRGDRFAIRSQWRTYFNKERQSGAFIGLYGVFEYRKMYWLYEKDGGVSIGFDFPFSGENNVYHSLGLTAGFDVGFRLRIGNVGITPFIGLGYPLFFCWGDLPSRGRSEFDSQNAAFRSIDIGLRIDFFITKDGAPSG